MNSSDKTIEEYSKQAELATERRRKSKDIARKLWQGLVVNVGKTQAKEIMREVMDDKKPGPRSTDKNIVFTRFIGAILAEHSDQRSLAGAGRPDDGEHLAATDVAARTSSSVQCRYGQPRRAI
jgi:hypothetical protein